MSHMLWGAGKHLAFAYLVYSLLQHYRGESPQGAMVAVLFLGVMFPDLVDKSLVWIGVLEYGRSFAHSLLTAAAFIGVTALIANAIDHTDLGRTFGLGYLLHLPVDLYGPLLTGNHPIDTAFLFWPLITEYPLGVMPPGIPLAKRTVFRVLLVVALLLWTFDGFPILDDLLEAVRSRSPGSQ